MGRTACTEPQCLYTGALYLTFYLTLPSTSALDGSGWSTPRPGHFTPRKSPGTHCIGDWVAPGTALDRCGKISPQPGFDPRTVQPVASRYLGPPLAPEPFTSPVGNFDSSDFNLFGSLKTGVPKLPRNIGAISKF